MPGKKQPVFSFKLSAPALRALTRAGIYAIEDFADWTEADVKKLHGIGPSAMKAIKKVCQKIKSCLLTNNLPEENNQIDTSRYLIIYPIAPT
jgi:DNA-directed RNA polymerase alpha subunit